MGLRSRGVALPGRLWDGDDHTAFWPRPRGGANGTIDVPGRTVAGAGDGLPAMPGHVPTTEAGARGVIPNNVRYAPGVDASTPMQYNNGLPMPRAWIAMHYVRHFVSSGALSLLGMGAQRAGFNWTLNRASADGAPSSPIPVSRRFLVQTFAEPYGEGRIWETYMPRPAIQAPVGVRRILARRQLPRMTDPYFPRLTTAVASGGSGAQTLAQAPADAGNQSPYGTTGLRVGRFSR